MPIYLCKPGWDTQEPWRHGVQVYDRPFPIEDDDDFDMMHKTATVTSNTTTSAAEHSHSQPQEYQQQAVPFPPPRIGERVQIENQYQNQETAHANLYNPTYTNSRTSTRSYKATTNSAPNANAKNYHHTSIQGGGKPLRRIRHAEVVLVDEVSIWYERYWLRLRWPGPKGGFAGYIALGKVMDENCGFGDLSEIEDDEEDDDDEQDGDDDNDEDSVDSNDTLEQRRRQRRLSMGRKSNRLLGEDEEDSKPSSSSGSSSRSASSEDITKSKTHELIRIGDTNDDKDKDNDDNGNENLKTSKENKYVMRSKRGPKRRLAVPLPPRCESTGLYYPSSAAMELLLNYDDGIILNSDDQKNDSDSNRMNTMETNASPTSRMNTSGSSRNAMIGTPSGYRCAHEFMMNLKPPGDAVFCRICREGLHDVNYDLEVVAPPPPALARRGNAASIDQYGPPTDANNAAFTTTITNFSEEDKRQHLLHQATKFHPTAENPLLAPCTCSGSMAFVHYLCIEQWRCRSRHPAAKDGLNCETCGSAYALPPPPVRPTDNTRLGAGEGGGAFPGGAAGRFPPGAEEEWLEAMPAHVLAALRRPHLGWRIGAALVRQKALRPFAPVLLSPLVALYCRARRMLKKRGVSRRRWACSLCRRRARWKCVRCLRSYYCSRQCQNVSWHIMHKHVCYKPARFGWSVVVYVGGLAALVPGTWKNPLVYITGLAFIPFNFYQIGILAGGIATFTKKIAKIDMRGRILELSVVLITLVMSFISWGLINGFFDSPQKCAGVMYPSDLHSSSSTSSIFSSSSHSDKTQFSEIIIPEAGKGYEYKLAQYYKSSILLRVIYFELFQTIQFVLNLFDRMFFFLIPSFFQRRICTIDHTVQPDYDLSMRDAIESNSFCFESIKGANPNFIWQEEKCAKDLKILATIYLMAFSITLLMFVFSKRNRRGRGAGGNVGVAQDLGGDVADQPAVGVRGRRNPLLLMGARMRRPHQD